ncbi:hypothetical protein DNTS_025460, partial [Danionella cerebrum]
TYFQKRYEIELTIKNNSSNGKIGISYLSLTQLGLCCGSLEEQKGQMKMGLCMVLVGHVNFLLGALVHGVVLRHFSLQRGQAMESAISNVIALVAGMLGAIIGIHTIVLSKNRTNKVLTWSLLVLSAVAALVSAASVVGLTVSLIKTLIHGEKRLLTYCGYSDGRSDLIIANECPFDPTRIFSTTVVLWVPLILMSAVEVLFSCRLLKLCMCSLGVSCCLHKQPSLNKGRLMKPPRLPEFIYAPQSAGCQGDVERKLPVRPPVQHNSRPPSLITACGRNCEQPGASPFNRAALERNSIWI